MISAKWLKLIKSLQIKKYRQLNQSFLVEGAKSVLELLESDFTVRVLFATEPFLQHHIRNRKNISFEYAPATEDELARAGSLQTNNACLAVVATRPNQPLFPPAQGYALVLDGVQDPGNLGTILRIADWYGLDRLVCSEDTVDVYNPKVIASSMGSFTRVRTYACSLPDYLADARDVPRYGAFLEGENVHQTVFAPAGLLVMGSESHGIRPDVAPLITRKIHIPRYGGAESLNVGIATAVICDNLRRNLVP